MASSSKKKHVIVTTEHRGVFFGTLKKYETEPRVAHLEDVVMAIYWGTTQGLLELAATGPTSKSKLSATAPAMRLEKVTSIIDCTDEATEAWARATS